MQSDLKEYYKKRIARIQEACREKKLDETSISDRDAQVIKMIGNNDFVMCEFALVRSVARSVYRNTDLCNFVVPLTNTTKPSESAVYASLMHYIHPLESRDTIFDTWHLHGLRVLGDHLLLSSTHLQQNSNHDDVTELVDMIIQQMTRKTKHQFILKPGTAAKSIIQEIYSNCLNKCLPLFQHLIVHLFYLFPDLTDIEEHVSKEIFLNACSTMCTLHQYFQHDSNSPLAVALIRAFHLCHHPKHYSHLSLVLQHFLKQMTALESEIIPEKEYRKQDQAGLWCLIQYYSGTILEYLKDKPYSIGLVLRHITVQICWPMIMNQWIHKECHIEGVSGLQIMALIDVCMMSPDAQLGMYIIMLLCYGTHQTDGINNTDHLLDVTPAVCLLKRLLPDSFCKEDLTTLYNDLLIVQALGSEMLFSLDDLTDLSPIGKNIQKALLGMKAPRIDISLNEIKEAIHLGVSHYGAYLHLVSLRPEDPYLLSKSSIPWWSKVI